MLAAKVRAELDRLLPSRSPIAVAYSGGGDSTALLHLLRDRASLAVIVDHGLSETSAQRTREAARRAEAMGVKTIQLLWTTPKRQQAAARNARYTMMGEVCRVHGIRHLVIGHTRDDQSETLTMRRRRDPDALGMDPIAYAPVWPGLRNVALIRPMLDVSRDALRDYLNEHGLDWDEDPANSDTAFERVRVRATQPNLRLDRRVRRGEAEELLGLMKSHIRFNMGYADCAPETPPRLMALALTCVAGASEFISENRLGLCCARDDKSLTVGGGRIVPHPNGWRLLRDPGGVMGRAGVAGLAETALEAGTMTLWDNRILVTAKQDVTLKPLGRTSRNSWLRGQPAPHIDIRRTLPGAFIGGQLAAVPANEGNPGGAAIFEDVAQTRLRRLLEARAV